MKPTIISVGPRPSNRRHLLAPLLFNAVLGWAGLIPSAHANQLSRLIHMDSLPVVSGVHSPVGAPSLDIGTWTSRPGEKKDVFIKRLAVALHEYTSKTRYEACGMLAHNATTDQWRVHVTTNQSHMGCIEVSFDAPDFISTGVSIHSHPKGGGVTPNPQDAALFPQRNMKVGHERVQLDSDDFSQIDYSGGPGYVVVPGPGPLGFPGVLFQDGSGPHSRVDLGGLPHVTVADITPDARVEDVARSHHMGEAQMDVMPTITAVAAHSSRPAIP